MKRIAYLLSCILLVGLSGCGVEWAGSVPDCYSGRSTTIGADIGFPEGLSLVLGYKSHDGVICRCGTSVILTTESVSTMNGLDITQVTAFGKAAEDITIKEDKDGN